MKTVTVSDKGQIVIPAEIRRGLGIKAGTQLDFELEGSSIRISLRQNVPAARIDSGYGLLRAKPSRKPRNLAQFDAAAALRPARGK